MSEAVDLDIPVEIVLDAADWSPAGIFKKHYHRKPQIGEGLYIPY